MSGIRTRLAHALAPARAIVRAHLRTLLPVAVVAIIGLLGLTILTLLYAKVIGAAAYQQIVASIQTPEDYSNAVAGLMVPLVLVALVACFVWAGTVTQAASAAYDRKRVGMPGAAWRGVKRLPQAVVVVLLYVAGAIYSIVASPVLLIVWLARSRDASLRGAPRPAGVRVPLKTWSLALPAVWIDGMGVRQALAESAKRAKWSSPLVVLIAAIVSAGVSEGAAALVPDPGIQLVVRIVALLLVGALPFVALAVLYRRGSDAKPAAQRAPMGRKAKLAAALAVTLVLPFAVGVGAGPANADAGTTVTISQDIAESRPGADFTVTVQVTGTAPTGNVSIEADPVGGGAAIDLGTYPIDGTGKTVQVVGSALAAGDYQLIARYAGDGANAAAASAPLAHTVTLPRVDFTVTSVAGSTGDTATLMIVLTPHGSGPGVTGDVTVNGGAPIPLNGSSIATAVVDVAAAGSRQVTITYGGDSWFGAGSTVYTVPRLETAVTVLDADVRTATYGDSQTYAGVVRSGLTGTTPTGNISLKWKGGIVATTALVGGGFSFTTTAMGAGSGSVTLLYEGDASHAPGDNSTSPVTLSVAKATAVPVVTTTAATVGDNASLTATLPASATGDVTFTSAPTNSIPVTHLTGGVATQSWTPTTTLTYITATYPGDDNYNASTSGPIRFDVARAPVTVSIADPGAVGYGDLFTLHVTVKVGVMGVRPDHTIDFYDGTGAPLAQNVYVDAAGNAQQDFCARSTGCPADYVVLGSADRDIVAKYGEDTNNLEGSATYQYRPGNAATTTMLEVTPSTIIFGSEVTLKATVTASTTPTGLVSFYGVKPDGSLAFLKAVALDTGVAQWTTRSGDDEATDLVWPENKVKAVYDPDGALFSGSQDEVAITLGRVGTSLSVTPVTPVANVSTPIVVTISHDPGASADYRGSVTMTSDDGSICTVYPAPGAHTVTCTFRWTTAAAHSITTSYSGDVVYLPAAATTTNLTVGTLIRTPSLGLSAPAAALVGDDVTVTWHHDPSMTGNVMVVADGSVWCTVPIATDTCTGRFPIASAGGWREIHLIWSGDAGWYAADEQTLVSVTRCAQLDVRSDSTLGTVRVDTPANCGATGYDPGTIVQVTALPKAPGEFGYWLGYRPPAPNMVLVDSSPVTRFVVTANDASWVRVAHFQVPCSPVTPLAAGFGSISVYPGPNCPGGYLYGTKVTIYPDGLYNPTYDEPDAFWSWGTLPEGAVAGFDTSARPLVHLTVTGPAVIPVHFGPVCRPIEITFSPASDGDGATFDPLDNCSSPTGGGYLRGTSVTAHATPGDPSMAITGWTLNGAPAPDLGTTSDPTVVVDNVVPKLVATVVHCYSVEVGVDAVLDRNNQPTGAVKIDGTKCPDGSDRYLGGSTVTLTPQVLAAGSKFNGWDEHRIAPVGPASGATGDVSAAARTLVLDRDIQTTAGFFDPSACSVLQNVGSPGLLTFDDSGCGPGYYLDFRKQQASAQKIPVEQLTGEKYLSSLSIQVHQPGKLPVYVSIHGEVSSSCTRGAATTADGWTFLGAKSGLVDCRVSGPIQVDADQCQPVVTSPTFTVQGRPGTYGVDSMPGTFYVTGGDGLVSASSDFPWGRAVPVTANGSKWKLAGLVSGTCAAKDNLFLPNTDVLLYAAAPGSGFSFDGWTGFAATPVKGSPLHLITDDATASLTTGAAFTVRCATVTFGEGIHLAGDAPRCPGTAEADNSFIVGTSIPVRADYQIGNRTISKFTSGVAGDQIYQDPATLDFSGFAYVPSDGTKVTALYQSSTDRTNTEIIKGLKFGVGIIAVVAPTMLGMIFPPAGIYFGLVGAIAGIAGAIPGGQDVAAAFDLINPTKITGCIARWGFNDPGTPGSQNVGSILSTAKTTATAVFTDTDVLVQNIGVAGVAAGAGSIALGLYSAGIGNANLVGPQSVEELRDTATIQGCLDHEWRVTDGGAPSPGSGNAGS